jgi:hypothetical protein
MFVMFWPGIRPVGNPPRKAWPVTGKLRLGLVLNRFSRLLPEIWNKYRILWNQTIIGAQYICLRIRMG